MKNNDTHTVTLESRGITLEEYMAVVRFSAKLEFSEEFLAPVRKGRALIDRFLAEDRAVYGVTTGFGDNVQYAIPTDEALELQRRIVRSHSVAVGKPLEEEKVRAILLQMILNARGGHTGLSVETLEAIRAFLNEKIVPFAPGSGSVGYLSVEAHIVMALIGEGSVLENGVRIPAADVLKKKGFSPVVLKCKEGLSLLNGTISVTALAVIALYDAETCVKTLDIVTALCFEALKGTVKALDERILRVKNHREGIQAARNLRAMLRGSEIAEKSLNEKVQDCTMLRAAPQLLGSVHKLFLEAEEVILDEMHAVSDNPEIFAETDDDGTALMCGNFEGNYVGSHADILCMAAAIAAKQLESGINRMVNHHLSGGLPDFLVAKPGLNNGFMIVQYTAAGLNHEVKALALPATADNISTCADQEDPVSMAYSASKKACESMEHLLNLTALYCFTVCQAVDFRKPLKPSPFDQKIIDYVRREVPFVDEDRYLYPGIEVLARMVKNRELIRTAEESLGTLEL